MILLETTWNPWDALSSDIGFNDSLTSIGADWYTLCKYIGVIGLVLSIIVLAIKLMTSRGNSSGKVLEVKEGFIIKIIIAIAISMLTFIVGTVYGVAVEIGS